jgi:hypothetical protein
MKNLLARLALAAALGGLLLSIQPVLAQGTAFTYQGQLNDSGSPANGNYDLQFSLFDAAASGNQVGGTVTNLAVGVTNGLFTTTMDFGPGIFTGNALWLQIGVETNGGGGNFTLLGALQPLTPTPYSIYAASAGTATSAATATTAGSVSAGSITGGSIASGQVVKSVNGLTDDVTLAAGANVTIIPTGNTLTINSAGGGGPGSGWSLTGNAATTAGVDFLGTTDNQPLELHVNGMRGTRLEPTPGDANHAGIINVVNGASVNFAMAGVYGATISGGGALSYDGSSSTTNSVTGDFGTVGGGIGNTASSSGTVGGGLFNQGTGFSATVAGGEMNISDNNFATVGGGQVNYATGFSATVAGGAANTSGGDYATVGGGIQNSAGGLLATVCGGTNNNASGPGSFVGGGGYDGIFNRANTASGQASAIAGGMGNVAGPYASVGGGAFNTSGGFQGAVAGGYANSASGDQSSVGGGAGNQATNTYATVPGGYDNIAGGPMSFAAGNTAYALHRGAFVWADSQSASFSSTGNNQFCVRAEGGVQLDPSTSLFCASQTRQMLNLWSSTYGIGVQTDDLYFRSADEFWWYKGGSHNDGFGNAGGGTMLMRLGSTGSLVIAGTLTQNSDRNVKSGFQPVDPQFVLEKIAAMPFSRWHYTNDVASPHIGPMAQDFYAAFGLGEDDKHITTVDEGGIALAAIQGLNQKLERESKEKDTEIQALKQSMAELKQIVQTLAKKK